MGTGVPWHYPVRQPHAIIDAGVGAQGFHRDHWTNSHSSRTYARLQLISNAIAQRATRGKRGLYRVRKTWVAQRQGLSSSHSERSRVQILHAGLSQSIVGFRAAVLVAQGVTDRQACEARR
ncbi:unnamed protein product [Lampetra planeri]